MILTTIKSSSPLKTGSPSKTLTNSKLLQSLYSLNSSLFKDCAGIENFQDFKDSFFYF